MAAIAIDPENLGDEIKRVIDLELRAVAVGRAVTSALSDGDAGALVRRVVTEEEARATELAASFSACESAPMRPDARSIIDRGKVALGRSLGEHAALRALRSRIEDVAAAYGHLARRADLSTCERAIVEPCLEAVRRLCRAIDAQIAASTPAPHIGRLRGL